MKFTVNKNEILQVLSKVQGLASRKTNLAITTNVLITAADAGIIIRATDLETGFEGLFPAKVEREGSVAIHARKLFEIVRDFPSDQIHINEIENHWIEIGNQNVEYHLVGMNPDDFPELPQFDDMQFVEVDAVALNRMIEQTVFISGASDDKRAHIVGLYMEAREQKDQRLLRIVSTDGSRLSKVDHLFDKDVQLPFTESVLVPKKGMVEVAKFLEPEETVKFGVQDSNLVVKKENETIIVRLLEGEFPEYEDIVRKRDNAKRVPLERQLFLMMLKRMSILSTEEYRSVIFHFVNDKLLITSTNPDIGESKEDMPIQFDADPIEVAFNPRFFIEALNVIDSETVLLDIVDDEKPCMLAGEGDPGFITVIMPMRI
jgi:DNA polymerase-3 subunit beta